MVQKYGKSQSEKLITLRWWLLLFYICMYIYFFSSRSSGYRCSVLLVSQINISSSTLRGIQERNKNYRGNNKKWSRKKPPPFIREKRTHNLTSSFEFIRFYLRRKYCKLFFCRVSTGNTYFEISLARKNLCKVKIHK